MSKVIAELQNSCSVADESQTCANWLLQLPHAALALVVQELDTCSFVCAAATCSNVSDAVISW
jgi:hypothetical protein